MEFIKFLRFFLITLFLLHQFQVECSNDDSSSVLFIDSNSHQFLRKNVEITSMSIKEVGAVVSVLLGLAPADISAASSAKLNELLLPNPFDRPRHVFLFEIGLSQDSEAMAYANRADFTSGIKSKVIGIDAVAAIELPDLETVAYHSLDGLAEAISDEQISDFANRIGGNFESSNGELSIHLPSGSELNLLMSKEADRKFVSGLIYLLDNIRNFVEAKRESSESSSNVAELVEAYFDGIKAFQEEYGSGEITQQGMELLMTLVSRLFDSLQAMHRGEAVAVLLFNKAHSSQSQRMLDVTVSPARPAAHFMEEVKQSSNSTTAEEVRLVRLTVAWATGILLLIAAYIGAYLLLYMPVTKDTLLYSNVKLD